MYRVIKDDSVMCYSDAVNFIRVLDNGNYTPCEYRAEATGVVIGGTVYALLGDEDQYPGKEAVAVEDMDGGEVTYSTMTNLAQSDEMTVDHEFRLTCLELGTTTEEASTLMA